MTGGQAVLLENDLYRVSSFVLKLLSHIHNYLNYDSLLLFFEIPNIYWQKNIKFQFQKEA